MAPRAHIERTEVLGCVERNGVILSLTKGARVVNLTEIDHNSLWQALEAAGIPLYNSTLTSSEGTSEFLFLTLRERSVKMHDETTADVVLTYEHPLQGGQDMVEGATLWGRMRTSLQQVKTNKYTDYTDPDNPIFDRQIQVQHTYPRDPVEEPDYPGRTIVQGGEIEVPVPQKNYVVEFFFVTDFPGTIRNHLIGHMNSVIFLFENPKTWLCTDVQHEMAGPGKHWFRVEWQHDPDTWERKAVFIDARTGRPPPALVDGVGIVTVPGIRAVDFMEVFPDGVLFGDAPAPPIFD